MLKAWILSLFFIHAYHTSLTEVNFNPKTKSLECSIRIFSDDLSLALTQISGHEVKIEDPNFNLYLEKYIRKNFALVSPSKNVKLAKFIGRETEGDATWVFVEIEDCDEIRNYTLFNTILIDHFDDQTNLVNIIYPGYKKTLIFTLKNKIYDWPY